MNGTVGILAGLAIVVAAAMTVIVLRLVLQERRRSAARVAALAADIYSTSDEDIVVLHDPDPILQRPRHVVEHEPRPVDSPRRSAASMEESFPADTSAPLFPEVERRRSLPIAPFIAMGAAVVFVLFIGASHRRAATAAPAAASVPAQTQALELLSLDHEQSDDRLTVRGVVRNPLRGGELDHLTAVVLLFNREGGFLTSGRSPVESAVVQPGTQAHFVVTVPGAADVGKYRVSFRTDDRVIPHVDRR